MISVQTVTNDAVEEVIAQVATSIRVCPARLFQHHRQWHIEDLIDDTLRDCILGNDLVHLQKVLRQSEKNTICSMIRWWLRS